MPCGASTSSLCVCQFRHLRKGVTYEVYQRSEDGKRLTGPPPTPKQSSLDLRRNTSRLQRNSLPARKTYFRCTTFIELRALDRSRIGIAKTRKRRYFKALAGFRKSAPRRCVNYARRSPISPHAKPILAGILEPYVGSARERRNQPYCPALPA